MVTLIIPKGKDARGTLLDARGTTDAFRILHGQTFVREVHDVDALMADRSANVARNAFRFLGENPKARKACIDMHERGERTKETAPDAARVFKIKTDADDPTEEHINGPFVVGVGDQPSSVILSFKQQVESGGGD